MTGLGESTRGLDCPHKTKEADAAQARLAIESATVWPMGIAEAYAKETRAMRRSFAR